MPSSDQINTEIVVKEKELAESIKSVAVLENAKVEIAIEIQKLKNQIGGLLLKQRELQTPISTGRHNIKILEITIGDLKRQYFAKTKEGL